MRQLMYSRYTVFLIASIAILGAQSASAEAGNIELGNGLVIHHADSIDYDLMQKQISKQMQQ